MKQVAFGAVAALAATASFASIPPAYLAHLPPERHQGEVTFITGGQTRAEEDAVKRASQEWPLELVFTQKDAKGERDIGDMPVVITDARGHVVFDGVSRGPVFIAKLPPGEYTVTTHWDAWDFSRPVTIAPGRARERVVFEWKREGAAA